MVNHAPVNYIRRVVRDTLNSLAFHENFNVGDTHDEITNESSFKRSKATWNESVETH